MAGLNLESQKYFYFQRPFLFVLKSLQEMIQTEEEFAGFLQQIHVHPIALFQIFSTLSFWTGMYNPFSSIILHVVIIKTKS